MAHCLRKFILRKYSKVRMSFRVLLRSPQLSEVPGHEVSRPPSPRAPVAEPETCSDLDEYSDSEEPVCVEPTSSFCPELELPLFDSEDTSMLPGEADTESEVFTPDGVELSKRRASWPSKVGNKISLLNRSLSVDCELVSEMPPKAHKQLFINDPGEAFGDPSPSATGLLENCHGKCGVEGDTLLEDNFTLYEMPSEITFGEFFSSDCDHYGVPPSCSLPSSAHRDSPTCAAERGEPILPEQLSGEMSLTRSTALLPIDSDPFNSLPCESIGSSPPCSDHQSPCAPTADAQCHAAPTADAQCLAAPTHLHPHVECEDPEHWDPPMLPLEDSGSANTGLQTNSDSQPAAVVLCEQPSQDVSPNSPRQSSLSGAELSAPTPARERPNQTIRNQVKHTSIPTLIEDYLGPLYRFSEGVKRTLVKQARDILVCRYGCDLHRFELHHLQPIARVLDTLSQVVCQRRCWSCGQCIPLQFPLCSPDYVVLQLGEIEATLLRHGDFYFKIQPSLRDPSLAELFLCCQSRQGVQSQHLIPSHAYPNLLTMENLSEFLPPEENDAVLVDSLKNLIVTLEKGLERLQWEAFVYNWGENPMVSNEDEDKDTKRCFVDDCTGKISQCPTCKCLLQPSQPADPGGEGDPGTAAGEVSETLQPNYKSPISVVDLKWSAIESGVLCLPGIRTSEGSDVAVLDVEVLPDDVTVADLVQIICYYNSVRRKEGPRQSLTIVTREKDLQHVNFAKFVESAALLKEEFDLSFKELVILVDQEPCTERSGIALPVTKCSWEVRSRLIERLNFDLPESLGGSFVYCHSLWLDFRKILEPFVLGCRSAGHTLVAAMNHVKDKCHPECANEAKDAIKVQRQLISRVLGDESIQRLIADGEGVVAKLQLQSSQMPDNRDLSDWSSRALALYTEVRRSSISLRKMADRRISKLEKFLRLQDAAEEGGEVLTWLCQKGEETLKKHKNLADSLAGIRQQEKEFEKFYFVAMRNIEKGNDLVEDTDGGGQDKVRELGTTLKYHLKSFTERLEETREKLEDSSRCYLLLDKAYEWALDAMKYMAYIKPEEGCIPEVSKHLLEHLDHYLELHPPLGEELFVEMLQIAAKLGNSKLLAQCEIAKSRCEETWELIQTRRTSLALVTNSATTEGDSPEALQDPSILTKLLVPCDKQGHTRRKSLGSGPSLQGTPLARKISCEQCSCTDDCIYMNCRRCAQITQETLGNIAETCENSKPSSGSPSDPLSTPKCRRKLNKSKTWQEYNPDFLQHVFSRVSSCYREGHPFARTQSYSSTTNNETHAKHHIYQNVPSRSCKYSNKTSPVSVNSHLDCRSSSLDLAVRIAGDELINMKNKKTILMIMQEMIQTERDYVTSLEYVIEHYVPELFRDDIPQALRGQRNVVFGNIEKIYEFHNQYFLKELQACESGPFQVGQCFLRHEKQFYLYALYNKNKPKSEGLMSEYGSTFFKRKQVELGDRMDLGSYLLKPVQRMGKYALLLKQLLKECPAPIQEYSELTLAEEMVRFQLRHGNDLLAMDSLRDCDVNLKEQGRLLRQDEFVVWQAGGVKNKKCLRHVFLFEDLILFSKSRRDPERKNLDLYVYKHSIKMTDIGMTEKILEGKTRFEIWFRKRKPNDTFVLQAPSLEVKNAWTNEISRLLWKQALRNRELRLAEMCSMGIGNKPCLDIKASEDQINDRSINVSKVPRFRNSIASSCGGDNPVINKRPQSIISVSSSSSGSSSHSSCGMLNLGFDPVDSPKQHHKSVTIQSQCSTESGILADFGMFCEDESSNSSVQRSNSTVTSISTDSDFISLSPLVNTPHRNDHMVTEL